MCFGSTRNFSIKMSSLPNAFSASFFTSSKAGSTSSGVLQRRMPRPPPPAAAFKMTGKPNDTAFSSASCAFCSGSVHPGIIGTPALMAISFALSLSPIMARILLGGPINWMPASSHACANAAFSDKKPYPGWIASTPRFFASLMMPEMSRYAPTGLLLTPISYASSACVRNWLFISSWEYIATVRKPRS